MPTNDQGDGDAQEATEDKTSDDNNDDVLSSIEDEETREKVRKQLISEREQKKHWRNKAKDEGESDSADNSGENDETDDAPDVSKVNERIDRLEQNQKLARDGYSDKEIAEARAYAEGKDMDVTEAVETDFVQSAIQSMRNKQQSQENTPGPSSQVQLEEGKNPSDVLNDDEASDEEKDAALQQKVQEHLGEGRSSHE